jgi:hypothetical protein
VEKAFRLFTGFVVGFFLMLAGCEQWQEPIAEIRHGDEELMTMSPVTAADYGGTLPLASILCPDAGEKVKAEDIRQPVAALLAEVDDIRNNATTGLVNKVDRDGDLGMTGAFEINNGTLEVTAPAPNNNAITGIGQGVGAGLVGIGGATGPGLTAGSITLPSTSAASIGAWISGSIRMMGDSPDADVDPGEDNTIVPQSINSSSITFETDGAGGVTVSNSNGFNVDAVTIFGDNQTLIISFTRNLPSSGYRPHFGEFGTYKAVITGRATNQYTIKVWDLVAAAYINVSTTSVVISATTVGY